MPCPLFEPKRKADPALDSGARLPLVYEFEGICHAGENIMDAAHRFHYCNRGYAKGNCLNFPTAISLSALRFDVTGRTPSILSVLVIEEENHWPRAWTRFSFSIQDGHLEPEIADVCRRAQVFQFCLSYLEKF
jgi:hypothetical protein